MVFSEVHLLALKGDLLPIVLLSLGVINMREGPLIIGAECLNIELIYSRIIETALLDPILGGDVYDGVVELLRGDLLRDRASISSPHSGEVGLDPSALSEGDEEDSLIFTVSILTTQHL